MKRFIQLIAQGLLVVLPLLVTIWILVWFGTAVEDLFSGPLKAQQHLKGKYVPGMGIALGIILAVVVGIVARFWLVQWAVRWFETLIHRLPIVKTLYDSVRDLLGFLGGQKKSFNRAVLVRLPTTGLRVVGFVTQESLAEVPSLRDKGDLMAVYLSYSYAFMGMTVLVPREDVEELDMTVGEALRFQLTAGVSTHTAEPTKQAEQDARIESESV